MSDVEFLGHPDGTIGYDLPLRRDLTAAFRRLQPDVVITSRPAEPRAARLIGRAVPGGQ